MSETQPLGILPREKLPSSSLVVAWSEDAGKLGPKVVDYLNRKLGGQESAEIAPEDFFPLDGVSIEDDVAQFPASKFYWCRENNLVVFKSTPPRSEWYEFLNSVIDIAEGVCEVKELYTIGGMVSANAHTAPRLMFAVANSPEVKEVLGQYDVANDLDFETPPGQRPTLNSFLLWIAKRRNIPGANLWVPIPFYLVAVEDPCAWRKAAGFLDTRFGLGIDFEELDDKVAKQNQKIAKLRNQLPEIDGYINRLESSLSLTGDESEKLVEEVEELLRERY